MYFVDERRAKSLIFSKSLQINFPNEAAGTCPPSRGLIPCPPAKALATALWTKLAYSAGFFMSQLYPSLRALREISESRLSLRWRVVKILSHSTQSSQRRRREKAN